MRALVLVSALWVGLAYAYPQQAVDPAYLRQYYRQVASAAGAQGAEGRSDGTPIYEQGAQEQQHIPQYLSQAQQLRLKDNVQDQIQRTQYPQPQARQYQPQYQQPQIQYVQEQQYQPQPKQQLKISKPRPQYLQAGGQKLNPEEDPDDYDPNPSYQFGFDVKDDEFTNYQNRKETRDGNVIKGSYSVVDSDGFIRTVTYTADPKEGFKAEVSRQPTDIVVKVPTPAPQHQQQEHQRYVQASQPQAGTGAYRVQQQHQPQQHQHQHQQQAQQRPRPEYSQYQ